MPSDPSMTGLTHPMVILYGAVAAGAPPDEQDTLHEVQAVAEALERLGHRVEPVALTLDLEAARTRLLELRPLLVFNLVESVAGSGRLIHLAPALLEDLGLPYTGSPLDAMFLTSNKLIAKRWLASNGIATPAWLTRVGKAKSPYEGGELARGPLEGVSVARPWIVKSVWEHASIGLDDGSLVAEAEQLPQALAQRRARLGGDAYVEAYIDGRELNLSLIAGPQGLEVLPAAEIRFEGYPPGKPRIVGYAAKWRPDSFEYRHTVRSFAFPAADRSLLAELATLALRCAALFGVRGYARVDVRVDGTGRPWVLEVNANPCLAPDAGLMAAARQAGLGFDEVIARIVEDACRRETRNPDADRRS